MNDDWTWEASPKNGFARRKLERIYQMEYTEEEVEEPVVQTKPKKESKKMGVKRRPHKEPYWNFWRAVFAGWLIRYPTQIFKGIATIILGILLLGILVISEVSTDTDSSTIQEEVKK